MTNGHFSGESSSATAALFEPLLVKQVTLRNRIVMSPMTRRFSPGGVPTEEVANYYLRRVHGGVGLIITEGVGIDHPAALDDSGIPVMYGPDALAGWKRTVDVVHDAGGVIFPQLWHMGPMRKSGQGPYPEVRSMRPSGVWGPVGDNVVWNLDPEQVRKEGEATLPMSHHEIDEVIKGYARSAAAAKQVGFDGIAIHGAHGYMPDAFLWSGTNRRSDRYGGDIAQRTVFVQEMIRAVRDAIGADMPIMLRFSQWKQQDYAARLAHTPQELEQLLLPISEAGVDIFDASTRWFWKPEFPGSDLNLAGWAQKLTGKPAMTVGSVGLSNDLYEALQKGSAETVDLAALMERFNRGDFALVGVGRALLSDPAFANKIRSGQRPAAFDRQCIQTLS
jgi:2,4-dienoyl-CoA reductase-like NADH-dependent reductase (Old Yellow Enzyme family)